jgi:hypothetical protein
MVMSVGAVGLPSPVGAFKEPQEADYLATLTTRIAAELSARARDDGARVSVLLQSPGGKIYSVYVADDGTLASTLVHG